MHLHHIDGNNSNTVDENIAVLCVEDHDQHHRPTKYKRTQHLELSADKLREYKESWERFVADAASQNPSVVAVINVFGTFEQLHAARILFQWPDEKIEFERTFHLLEGGIDYWTDEMFSEIESIGKNITVFFVDDPLPVDYCPCCGNAYSNTIKEGLVLKSTATNWDTKSLMSIYINPDRPSLAILVSFLDKDLFSAHLHLCQGKYLHFRSDYYDERVAVKRRPSIRTQVTRIVEKVVADWEPAHIFIGTGDHDKPVMIDDFLLPRVWEKKSFKGR
ncbi:MAG: hypothetical protein ACTS2F_24220 [Thainema sp.]